MNSRKTAPEFFTVSNKIELRHLFFQLPVQPLFFNIAGCDHHRISGQGLPAVLLVDNNLIIINFNTPGICFQLYIFFA